MTTSIMQKLTIISVLAFGPMALAADAGPAKPSQAAPAKNQQGKRHASKKVGVKTSHAEQARAPSHR